MIGEGGWVGVEEGKEGGGQALWVFLHFNYYFLSVKSKETVGTEFLDRF